MGMLGMMGLVGSRGEGSFVVGGHWRGLGIWEFSWF